jgi:hypothetical protein
VIAALLFLLLQISQLYALQQTFWPNYQWLPPNWHFTYTNSSSVVYFTNSATVIYSVRQLAIQPTTDTSITPPATNSSAVYSNTMCILSFQDSTNGTDWYSAQATGQVCIAVIYTNSPMYIQMTNTTFSGTNSLGTFRLRANTSTTKPSSGQTLLAPTSGGYLISGLINAQWEGFGSGITWKPASTNVYLELSGPSVAPSILLQINQPTAGNVQVCWPTQTNYLYQVQKLSSLAGTNWSNLGSPLPGTGSTICQSYSSVGGSNQFYRVVFTNAP